MKGLLIKDFLYLRRQGRILPFILIICVALFVIPSFQAKGQAVEQVCMLIVVVTVVLTMSLSMNIVAMDEQAKWDGYARSLPVSVASAVGAQYVFAAILAACGLTAELIVGSAMGAQPTDLAVICAVCVGVPLLICSIMLPLQYKFGSQKASLSVMLLCLLVPAAVGFSEKHGTSSINAAQLDFWLKLSPVIAVALAFLSFLLSCRIYAKKEI